MTMLVSCGFRSFAALAWDSTIGRDPQGGRFGVPGGPLPGIAPFAGGWIGVSGAVRAGTRAISVCECRGRGSLDEIIDDLLPEIELVWSEDRHLKLDSQVVILTCGSGELEAGYLTEDDGLTRLLPGHRLLTNPAHTDETAVVDRWHEFKQDVADPASGLAFIRSTASLFANIAEVSPTLSGAFHLGLIQRRPGGEWESASMHGVSAEIAELSDQEISLNLRSVGATRERA